MQILKARPLATACMAALIGAVISFFLSTAIRLFLLVCLALFLLTFLVLFLKFRKDPHYPSRQTMLLTVLLSLGLSFLAILMSTLYFGKTEALTDRFVDADESSYIRCVILEEGSAGTGYTYYTVSVESINDHKVKFRATLECPYTATFHVGDVVQMEVLIHSLSTYYERDMLTYAVADHIRLALVSQDVAGTYVVETRPMPLRRFFDECRQNISARLYRLTGKENGGFVTALFLGDRSGVDERITMAYRRTGISHLLALSGMHVTLIMGMVASLTTRMYLPKRGRLILLAFLAILYLALIGFGISAVRAVGMLLLFYLADMLGKRQDPLTTLCLVGMGMVLLSPATVADGGFWMSFAAVFGLVTVHAEFNEWLNSKNIRGKTRTVLLAFAASAIAVVSVSFLNWLFSGEISLVGILLTVILSPVLTAVLFLTFLALLFDFIPFLSAAPLGWGLEILSDFMIEIADWAAAKAYVSISLAPVFSGVLLAVMTIVMLSLMLLPLRHKRWLVLPPLIAVLLFGVCLSGWEEMTYGDELQISYVSRSNGSALVVADREGLAVIDTSAGSFSMMRDIEKAVRAHGATEIEHLVLTHYHRAYIYSTERLAKRQIIRYVWLPIPQNEEEYYHLSAMRERLTILGVELRCYRPQEAIPLFGSALFHVTDVSYLERSEQPIITYLLQTPHEVLTFCTPSVEETGYNATARWIIAQTDTLIIGGHGPVIKQNWSLPFDISRPTRILSDTSELLAYLDLTPGSPIYEIPHVTDITCYRFSMRK